jgi:glycosyltransferase involved in cell wall biosynthesis
MKIVFISNLYPPIDRGGGAERVAQRIVDECRKRGHQVTVLSTKPFKGLSSFAFKQEPISAERLFRLFPFNVYYVLSDFKQLFPLRLLWHLIDLFAPMTNRLVKEFLEEEKPDIVFTHNLKGMGIGIARGIHELSLPWIHTLHDVQLSVPSGLLLYHKQRGLDYTFLRR